MDIFTAGEESIRDWVLEQINGFIDTHEKFKEATPDDILKLRNKIIREFGNLGEPFKG